MPPRNDHGGPGGGGFGGPHGGPGGGFGGPHGGPGGGGFGFGGGRPPMGPPPPRRRGYVPGCGCLGCTIPTVLCVAAVAGAVAALIGSVL